MRLSGAVLLAVLVGCDTVSTGLGRAPQECGWGNTELVWTGTGSLDGLGLQADHEFPHHEGGTVYIVPETEGAAQLLFCFAHADENRWIRGPVPDGWTRPNS